MLLSTCDPTFCFATSQDLSFFFCFFFKEYLWLFYLIGTVERDRKCGKRVGEWHSAIGPAAPVVWALTTRLSGRPRQDLFVSNSLSGTSWNKNTFLPLTFQDTHNCY